MEYNKSYYVTGKKVRFFPNDTYKKDGYIRNVDDLGWTYEVTDAQKKSDIGMHFRNHASNFCFQELKED